MYVLNNDCTDQSAVNVVATQRIGAALLVYSRSLFSRHSVLPLLISFKLYVF